MKKYVKKSITIVLSKKVSGNLGYLRKMGNETSLCGLWTFLNFFHKINILALWTFLDFS